MLAEKLISEEKLLKVNPFLSTRVMQEIENQEVLTQKWIPGILKPALVVLSVAGAIFLGVLMGSIPAVNRGIRPVPLELRLINDARLDSVDMLVEPGTHVKGNKTVIARFKSKENNEAV